MDQCPWPCSSLPRQLSLQAQVNVTEPWPDSLRHPRAVPRAGVTLLSLGSTGGGWHSPGGAQNPWRDVTEGPCPGGCCWGHSRVLGGQQAGLASWRREHPGQWETGC